MNKVKIISGIELGSSKVTTIIAQVVEDSTLMEKSVNVVGVASAPSRGIKKGQIVNIEEAVEATITSVEAAERMAGYNLNFAFISLGGAHIHSQNSHGVVAVSSPDGEITEIKLIDPKDIKQYFDWGKIGDRIIERAMELRGKL